jgi:hypothetical protein
MVTSTLNERLHPSLEEFGVWIALYHKTAQHFGGIKEQKLTIPFKSPDIAIATQVFLDRVAVVFRSDENDRTAPGKAARCVKTHRAHHVPVVSVRIHDMAGVRGICESPSRF